MNNEYNTSRPPLRLKEYGRNIQKLINFIKSHDDKEKRNMYAHTLVKLMKQVVPTSKDESDQKFWDDLFIMANFELDIDSPYPIPDKSILTSKPNKMLYHNYEVKFKHYGRNVELLIEKAIAMEDPKEKEEAIIYIGKLMKTFQSNWNKETVNDQVILKNIKNLSDDKLELQQEITEDDNVFEPLYRETKSRNQKPRKGGGGGRGRGRRKK